MSASTFIDTSVFVYAVDVADPGKQKRAQDALARATGPTVSPQVMSEFFVVTTRKLATPLPPEEAEEMIEAMALLRCVPIDADLVRAAVGLGRRHRLSHWDALMVAAAQRGGCETLLTEDLADGAVYDSVRACNPFKPGQD
ncbi:PIN domain-containing protein [Thermoactinospora rubra]|uniref:PIN domain-containing protein n=1 Tax=Thermoactinospora rubra TaxID=1088767 RepID=UPI001301BC07|nr:PIN domain-containing protein [Thermoactinospora rubra]